MSNTPSDIPASIGIGITTKDRWDYLAVTLEELRHHELCGLETIVIDDGSSEPMPTVFRQRFPWVKFERSENSQGYIVQRNRLAHMLTSELYLSLDDDSYPRTNAHLAHAAAWLIGQQDAVALAFSIQTPSEEAEHLTRRRGRAISRPILYWLCAYVKAPAVLSFGRLYRVSVALR